MSTTGCSITSAIQHFISTCLGFCGRYQGLSSCMTSYLSGVIAYMDASGEAPNGFATELYWSHGYEAVRQLFHAKSSAEVIYRYPCNLSVLQHAQGIIVHSAYSKRLAKQWYGTEFSDWAQIPLLRNPLSRPRTRSPPAEHWASGFRIFLFARSACWVLRS